MARKPALITEQEHLLTSWRKLLSTSLSLYYSLESDVRPQELDAAFVTARNEVARIKNLLRRSIVVDDLPIDEAPVAATAQDVIHARKMLTIYRRNLALWLQQQQEEYGSRTPPPHIFNSIVEAREAIAIFKRRLRNWSIPVDDETNDIGL